MLYACIKIIARAAIKLYCRDIQINNQSLLKSNGPLLLAANHPNSFLDAIILCTIFDKPVYSLARGDAFNGKLITKILVSLKMLPVYRISEGVENLEENYKTFESCKEIFRQNGIVLIFSEGRCVNEWHLRPLKKGTARLAISSWADGIPLKVLPVGINYSSFKTFGKNVRLYFGDFINKEYLSANEVNGKAIQLFNNNLRQQLEPFVYEIEATDRQALKTHFAIEQPALKKILLFIPSLLGWVLHAPLYYTLRTVIQKKTTDTDHFDSVVVSALFIAYPFYLLLITVLCIIFSSSWYSLMLILLVPFTGWAFLQLKNQFE